MKRESRSSLAVRAYMRALRVRVAFFRRLNLELDAIALGLLAPHQLAEFDELYYAQTREHFAGRNARYVDDDWNEQGLFGWEAAILDRHFPAEGRVVVTSAGAGREVLALLGAGYEAHGYEPNATLVKEGGRMLADRGHPGRLHLSPRDAFPKDAPEADAVIVGWGAYHNMQGRAVRVAFLRQVFEHVRPGVPVLVSYFSRRDDDTEHALIAARAGILRRLLRRAAPEVGDALQPNFVHRFTQSEARSEFEQAGFRVVESAAAPYGHTILERPAT